MFKKDQNGLWKIKNHYRLGVILIALGIGIRLFRLIYYYIVHLDPSISWGDVMINFHTTDSMFTGEWIWTATELEYPPLSLYLLVFFQIYNVWRF